MTRSAYLVNDLFRRENEMKFAENWVDVINLAVIVVGTILGLLQLGFLRRQVVAQMQQSEEENLKERRRHTLEMDARIASLTKERLMIRNAFPPSEWHDKTIPVETIRQECSNNPDLQQSIDAMLSQFEIFALPVCAGAADEGMAFELIGQTLSWYGTAFSDYVAQQNRLENRTDLYIYFIYLSNRWNQRLKAGYKRRYSLADIVD